MIGDGADAKGPLAVPGGVHIEGCRLHFQSHHAHFLQRVHAVQPLWDAGVVAVEHIGGIDVAHMVLSPQSLGGIHRGAQKREVRNGGKGAGNVELLGKIGIGTGTLGDHQVIQVDMVLDSTGRTHPDDILHSVAIVKLMGVDADGGHSHTGGHDGDLDPLVSAGVTLDAPDIVHKHRVFQKVLRNKFGAQRISRHQNSLTEIPGLRFNMGGRYS